MKRFLSLLISILLLIQLPVLADTGSYSQYTAPLLMRLATREGPTTEYAEPGSFFKKGETVEVLSITYDVNSVPWVQVEFSYRGSRMRAYTGLKRVDINPALLPLDEENVYAHITSSTRCYRGPGEGYARYDFTVPKGTAGHVRNVENGYCQFIYTRNDLLRLVWVPEEYVYSSRTNLPSPTSYIVPTQPPHSQGELPAAAYVVWTCQPYAGPGTQYAQFQYLVYSGTRGILYSIENNYAQFAYEPEDGGVTRIVWLPASFVLLESFPEG